MTPLERKKLEAEAARVRSARMDMEYRIEELKEALERITKDIAVQKGRETELEAKLKEEG